MRWKVAVVAMPRTGHHAIMQWIERRLGGPPQNIEGWDWHESMDRLRNGSAPLPILVLRDYPNWAASVLSYFTKHGKSDLDRWISNWISHARHAYEVPTILYPDWYRAGHGEGIVVTPSQFTEGSPLTRYEQKRDDPRWPHMMAQSEALAVSEEIFGWVGEDEIKLLQATTARNLGLIQ